MTMCQGNRLYGCCFQTCPSLGTTKRTVIFFLSLTKKITANEVSSPSLDVIFIRYKQLIQRLPDGCVVISVGDAACRRYRCQK
uniref:Uncharacterized protein n=1 Tax=Parascaris equorum TaxID=6256 RepID=A0A914SFP9_PAREQ